MLSRVEMTSNSAKKVTIWVCLKLNIDTISGEDILFVNSSIDNHPLNPFNKEPCLIFV